MITDLLGVNNEDELVVRNAIEEKVTPDKAHCHPGPKYKRFSAPSVSDKNLLQNMLISPHITEAYPRMSPHNLSAEGIKLPQS